MWTSKKKKKKLSNLVVNKQVISVLMQEFQEDEGEISGEGAQ